jgi:predicted metal-binding membrane protein
VNEAALETLLRRDRALVLAALVAVAALAWTYVLWLAAAMPSMDMGSADGMRTSGMDMAAMTETAQPVFRAWSTADFAFMFLMWAIMMVGMMLPSAAPMILIYARVGRQANATGQPFAATGWFAGGYLLAWTAFALLATCAQWALERALLLTPHMASVSNVFGGLVLIGAGLYQWTALKENCLSQCQTPLTFIQRHGGFRREPGASLRLGARHGLYCIGCCWALMGLLFVGGVMNLLWIAGLAIIVLVEKVVPAGRWLSGALGTALAGAGALLLISGL